MSAKELRHSHLDERDRRPPGECLACDEQHDKAMGVPVCYSRHEPAPGVHQDIPHLTSHCMRDTGGKWA